MASHRGVQHRASVHIAARDRAGLQRLLRYCARPPFALERLEATRSGATGGERIVYRLPRPAPGGGTALSLTPFEFLERLALLIPPPRIHRHRYHGVLAPNSRLRSPVIGLGGEQGAVEHHLSAMSPNAQPRIRKSHEMMTSRSAAEGQEVNRVADEVFAELFTSSCGEISLQRIRHIPTDAGLVT
ncbi:MAG: transposase [Gemmatimonadetes bacterium]|nr:transposase [Gemmatimonadota bacterium]